MTASRKITITAVGTVAAVLAATGIAIATPAFMGQPSPATGNPATGMMVGEIDHMPAGAGSGAGRMDQMHAGDVDWMAEMHAKGWGGGGNGAMHSQMGAMHGDAGQMARHHAQMIERDPQMQQRHDEMAGLYPEMREHMSPFDGSPGPGR